MSGAAAFCSQKMQAALALPDPWLTQPDVAFPAARSDNRQAVSVEHELIKAALDGDGRAFESLVRPHLAVLYRVAERASGNAALAEDAVQEALVIAYSRLKKYEPGTNLKAFLAAIAVQRAKTLRRGEQRRHAREEASDAPTGGENPAELVEAQRTAELVRNALADMPEKRRMAAILRLDAGMSYAEIATALGSTEGSTRVLVHLALKELKSKLASVLETTA